MPTVRAILRCASTVPKTIWWKTIYRSKIQLPLTIAVGRLSTLIIGKGGTVAIGKHFVALESLTLSSTGQLVIGEKCFINKNCSIACKDSIQIGEACSIANNVVIVDHDHDYKHDKNNFVTAPVKIGNRVWIGANCVILKGVIIGDDSVVAAGSIVRASIPPKTLYYEKRSYCIKENV